MGAPNSLLGNARAFARDFARDNMPPGYLWDIVDYVPQTIDTNLTGRGKWKWGSASTEEGYVNAGILAVFPGGDQLLVQTHGALPGDGPHVMKLDLAEVDQEDATWTDLGATHSARQNPVQLVNTCVHCHRDGIAVPQLWREAGPVSAFADMHRPIYATIWQGALISGGGNGPGGADESDVLRASIAGADLTTAASFDANAFTHTATRITGLATLRSMVLIFHPSSIERLRGGPLWNTAAGEDGTGLILDNLITGIGCKDPKTIVNWEENIIFADEHGVHLTDGATVRDLTSQGGISYYWRLLYEGADSITATVFLDYFIITVRHLPIRPPPPGDFHIETPPSGLSEDERPPVPPRPPDLPDIRPPVPTLSPDTYVTTLICDLNRKQWVARFSNVNAISYIAGGGSSGMERVWAGPSGYDRLIRVSPMFYPDLVSEQVDANGFVVKPRIETPWYRLGKEGRKRLRFGYLSYDAQAFSPVTNPLRVGYAVTPQTGATYSEIMRLPKTDQYSRFRFPINRAPYGIMFYVEAIEPTIALRLFDLAIEGWPEEASRV